jgi:hypothetical protein
MFRKFFKGLQLFFCKPQFKASVFYVHGLTLYGTDRHNATSKERNMKRDLKETLREIGTCGLLPEWDMRAVIEPKAKRGPSKWLEIHDDSTKYGKDFDFRIMDGDVFMPVCEAAKQWAYYVLPEGLDRYSDLDGNHGWRIPNGLPVLLDAAERDGLLSEEQYVENMNENDNAMRAGE